jgi:O-antigen/teichoic acid export membrane protein
MNSGVLLIDKLISALYLFLILILMVSKYSQIDYGAYQYALTLGILIGILLQFSDEKVVKHLFHVEGPSSVIFSTVILKLTLSLMVLLTYFLLQLFSLIDDLIAGYLLYFWLAGILINLPYAMMVYFDYRLNSKERAKAMIAGNTLTFLLQLYFIFNGYDIEYVAISVLCGAFITSTVILITFIRLKLDIKVIINRPQISNIFLRSVPFTLAAAAHMIYMRVDLLMIEYYMEYSSVAIYSVSTQLMALVAILIYPLQVALFPQLLKDKDKGNDAYFKQFRNLTIILTWVGVTLAVIGVLLIDPFVGYFFGEAYSPINNFFYIHMVSAVILYNSALRSSHITLIKKGYILLYSQIASLALNIVFNYLLIPIYGLQGAAFSTLVTITGSLLISNYFFMHTKPIFWVQLKAFYPKKFKLTEALKEFI